MSWQANFPSAVLAHSDVTPCAKQRSIYIAGPGTMRGYMRAPGARHRLGRVLSVIKYEEITAAVGNTLGQCRLTDDKATVQLQPRGVSA